jgi:peptide/nickel transport system substrate-binding protein
VTASVYFSSDVANPDTYAKFYTDIQMFTNTMAQPDAGVFLQQFLTRECASKENKWQGRNYYRYRNPEFDQTLAASDGELDPVKRAALLIKCNDMVIEDIALVPVVYRPAVHAMSHRLRAQLSGWDSSFWNLAAWYREA